jgi:hypothetical protein
MDPEKAFTHIEDMVPPEWKEGDGNAVFLVIYEVQGLPASELSEVLACELKDVRAFVVKGAISHREEVAVTQFFVDRNGRLNVVDPDPTKIVKTPDGLYLVFASPFTDTPGTNAGQLIAEERIQIAVGLFGSFQGRNLVFRRLSENTYSFVRRVASSWSTPLPVPITFPQPVLTVEGLTPILKAERARWSLAEPARNRLDLSLRWFGDGMFHIGVDAFLKYWFAIETLSMADVTHITPLNATLAAIYGYPSPAEVQAAFHTGLLYGLRSRIVHDGLLVAIDLRILRHCENLYHDLLRDTLGQEPQRRAAAAGEQFLGEVGALLRAALADGQAKTSNSERGA